MNGLNGLRGDSTSPAEPQPNGGVALPAGNPLHESERAANVYQPMHVPQWKGPAPVAGTTSANGDPFIKTSTQANSGIKLSAGAAAFQPGTKPSLMHILNHNSIQDVQPTIVTSPAPPLNIQAQDKAKTAPQQPIGTVLQGYSPSRPRVHFTTDVGPSCPFIGGHYIKIDNILACEIDKQMKILENDFEWKDKVLGGRWGPVIGQFMTFFVAFDDLRDTATAPEQVEIVNPMWEATTVSQAEYASAKDESGRVAASSFYDGQVHFVATFTGRTHEFTVLNATAVDSVKEVVQTFGEVFRFEEDPAAGYPEVQFRVEYYKISAAKDAIAKLTSDNPKIVGSWAVTARELGGTTGQSRAGSPGDDGIGLEAGVAAMGIATPHRLPDGSIVSPTGRSSWRTDTNGRAIACPPHREVPRLQVMQNKVVPATPTDRDRWNSAPEFPTPAFHMSADVNGQRSSSWTGGYYFEPKPTNGWGAVGGPQSVEIWKIKLGQDVRSTIMIRNVPNHLDVWDFKAILDKVVRGKYDFSYLRIDFHNHCNVGYAFVNFENAMDIITLVEAYAGKPWPRHTRRTFELSYATVQGYDCLVEKFRNSAVMFESPDYRAKLWYTDLTAPNTSVVGTEKPFPAPNNMQKLQRSYANAGQLGLYAKGSQRATQKNGRRSKWDRGTPAQITEDAHYAQQQQMSPQAGYGSAYGYGNVNYMMPPPMPAPVPPMYPQMPYGQMNGYHHGPGPVMNGVPVMPPQGYRNGYNGYYAQNGYHGQNGYQVQNGYQGQYGYHGQYQVQGPYAGNFNGGAVYNGHNAYNGQHQTPSRMRPHTSRRNDGHPKITQAQNSIGGPVQSPGGDFQGWDFQNGYQNGYSPRMPRVTEEYEPEEDVDPTVVNGDTMQRGNGYGRAAVGGRY